eukprot:2697441-Rhodomonas_salina.1
MPAGGGVLAKEQHSRRGRVGSKCYQRQSDGGHKCRLGRVDFSLQTDGLEHFSGADGYILPDSMLPTESDIRLSVQPSQLTWNSAATVSAW